MSEFIGNTYNIPINNPIIITIKENKMDTNQSNIIVKQRAVGMSTLTAEQTEQSKMKYTVNNTTKELTTKELTPEQLQAKKEALHQEKLRQRRVRKSVKNKALAVAKSKHDRRRIARGATAEQISNKEANVSHTRVRTLKREATRNMEKLSKKFSTKRVESTSVEETVGKVPVVDCQTVAEK